MQISKTLAFKGKKKAVAFSATAQVYGRNNLQKITETGHFTNATCTKLHVVARLFRDLLTNVCKIGAPHLSPVKDLACPGGGVA